MLSLKTCRLLFLWLLCLALVAGRAAAGEPEAASPLTTAEPQQAAGTAASAAIIPPDAVWYVSMDVKRFVESPLGQQVLEFLHNAIRWEIDDYDATVDLKAARAKLARVIGFDPLSGIASVTVYGLASPFAGEVRSEEELVEKMATTGVAVVKLSGGTGNLEGLALATPQYQSTEYRGATIHSGTVPDFPLRIHMAVLKPGSGEPSMVVFGLNEDQVKHALDRVAGDAPGGPTPSRFYTVGSAALPIAEGAVVAAGLRLDEQAWQMLEIPQQQSAIFRMLKSVAVSLGGQGDSLTFAATVEVVNQERAEQVRQLAEGAIAFLHLPIEELEREEELMMLRDILKDVEVSRDGAQVTCRLTKPADAVLQDLMRMATDNQQRAIESRRRVEERMREDEEKKREMQQRKRAGERDRDAFGNLYEYSDDAIMGTAKTPAGDPPEEGPESPAKGR